MGKGSARETRAEGQATPTRPIDVGSSIEHQAPSPGPDAIRSRGENPATPISLAEVRSRLARVRGPEFWRSLEELASLEEFQEILHREFPRQAAEWPEGLDRRRFLQLAGASLALAGLTACTRQPLEKIVPYVKQPEEAIPGRPLFFATAMTLGGYALGLLVESHEGRPTKIEGNPGHPSSLGATDAFAQASILGLYDPDRSQVLTHLGTIETWNHFASTITGRLAAQKALGGAGIRVLTESVTSPTLADQLRLLLERFPKAKWHQYEPAGRDAMRAGARTAFGAPVETRYDLGRADVIVTLDADVFMEGPGRVRHAREFASRRRVVGTGPGGQEATTPQTGAGSRWEASGTSHDGARSRQEVSRAGDDGVRRAGLDGTPRLQETAASRPSPRAEVSARESGGRSERASNSTMSRLYSVESVPTTTGTLADHRLSLRAGLIPNFVLALAAELGVTGAGRPAERQGLEGWADEATSRWIAAAAADLRRHAPRALVVPGEFALPAVHVLAHAINAALGAVGITVLYTDPVEARPVDQVASLQDLVDDMRRGAVDLLLILGGNPVFTAPWDLGFTDALLKVPLRVHLAMEEDETSDYCQWHVPQAHELETWSDARAEDGTATVMQPLIEPLYGGKSTHELLSLLLDDPPRSGHDIVRGYWQRWHARDGERGRQSRGFAAGMKQGAHVLSDTPGIARAPSEGHSLSTVHDRVSEQSSSHLAVQSDVMRMPPEALPTPFAGGMSGSSAVESRQAGGEAARLPVTPEAEFETFWRRSLHDGVVAGTAFTPKSVSLRADAVASAAASIVQVGAGVKRLAPTSHVIWTASYFSSSDIAPGDVAAADAPELIFRPDPTIHDGRFANSGWLQELPKPLSKLTWDNAALMAPALAGRLGLRNGDVVELKASSEIVGLKADTMSPEATTTIGAPRNRGRSVRAPVWVLPGHPDGAVTVHLGGGRRRSGRIGTGAGFDAYPLRATANLWRLPSVTVTRTGQIHQLATTQEHYRMEGRNLVRVGTLAEFAHNPEFAREMEEAPPRDQNLYPGFKYEGYAWGLAVDLNACTGCNACVLACVSENNIPVVGKDQVLRGREMHWLRIDRYYEGELDAPAIHHQPVLCMHCEQAPCELVCPVGATNHSSEGLNDMVYNRCVGTRYCSNNCPYKVRRFNFLKYGDDTTPVLKLLRNPDVTVRSRGVMEKCTYCVQRINEVRIDAEKENRAIRDREILTACQQACPAEAIAFGNINDPQSQVSRWKSRPTNYGLLESLNTRPRTTYLAKVRNPNPELEKA